MARKKLKLALISNDSSRKTTFKKRKMGIMKKLKELSTLCGVKACAIMYSPYDSDPQVWPSTSGVQSVISDFRALPEVEQHKKMVDQETFLRKVIAKFSEHVKRQRKDSRVLEMTEVMTQSLLGKMRMFHLNIMDLNGLCYLIDQYIKNLSHRMNILENHGMEISGSSNVASAKAPSDGIGSMVSVAATTVPSAMIHEVGSSSSSAADMAFFNPSQDQHHHQRFLILGDPSVGLYEQPMNLYHNKNQQQCFTEKIDSAAEQMGQPFLDGNHHNRNHHQHHHNQPQQQHIQGDSSTTQTDTSSSSLISAITNPNLTNNIWFP